MIKIFNDLKNELEEFKPIKEGLVTMYVCGVTVYDSPHLGHARSAVAFDLIRKYFEYRGYRVKFVMNYTDVDDKMINRANERGITIYELAQENIAKYEDMQRALFIKSPTVKPRATDEIPDMIKLIKKLEKKGFTYESQGSVYFDTSKMENYKSLFQKKDASELEDEEDELFTQSEFADDKKNIEDFVLCLKDNSVPIAICSGALLSDIRLMLKGSRIAEAFSVIAAADHVSRGKPDPQGYLLTIEKLRQTNPALTASRCVVIEDSPGGLEAARAAGMML